MGPWGTNNILDPSLRWDDAKGCWDDVKGCWDDAKECWSDGGGGIPGFPTVIPDSLTVIPDLIRDPGGSWGSGGQTTFWILAFAGMTEEVASRTPHCHPGFPTVIPDLIRDPGGSWGPLGTNSILDPSLRWDDGGGIIPDVIRGPV